MPQIDHIDGEYVVVRCTYGERHLFSEKGWIFSQRIRKWVTTDDKKARARYEFTVGRARERLDNITAMNKAAVADSWAEETSFDPPRPAGLDYMPFQRAGIEFAVDRNRVLIADPPGLGKTVQAIGIHNVLKTKKVLVICPASLKVNWSREFRKWDVHGLTVGIAMAIPKTKQVDGFKSSWTEYDWPETDVVIVNYDQLPTFDSHIKSVTWDQVIIDEAHNLKTRTTIRSRCVFGENWETKRKLKNKDKHYTKLKANRWDFLTGTPILSVPAELWTIIQECDPKGLGRDWNDYINRYCDAYETAFGVDYKGASNTEELNQKLRATFMVRRDKKAVLKELPDKTREIVVLPPDKLDKKLKKEKTRIETALCAYETILGITEEDRQFQYIRVIEDLSAKLQKNLDSQDSDDKDWEKAIRELSGPDLIMFTEIAAAREEVALAKVGMVAERVKQLVSSDEPVILFAYHKSVIAALQDALKDYRVGVVTGAIAPMKRQKVVDDFQEGKIDIIIGNILAMGVGFTLTRARFVVFAELDWVPALIEQAEDRAWRHGQKNAVHILYLVVEGSIEATMAVAIIEKMEVIRAVLDNRE